MYKLICYELKSHPTKKRFDYKMVTRTFFFFKRLLLSCFTSAADFEHGTDTKAQSDFNSITPNSSLFKLPCLKNKPAISPLDILSLRPPEI